MTSTADAEQEGRIAAATTHVRDAASQARDTAGHVVEVAVERVSEAVSTAKDSVGEAYSTAAEKASDTYNVVSQRASEAYAAARERAAAAGEATRENVKEYPAIAVIGAIAVGAVVAALLPRSDREAAWLGPIGAKIGDVTKTAFASAKEAGIDALGDAGLNRDAARTQVDKFLDAALGAAKAAGGAAAASVRKPA